MITAAARALAAGDPLGALKRVALREDASALALRGIAMAQLGDLARAKTLVRSAARAFTSKESHARAKCIVAEAEIAFAARDLSATTDALEDARITLESHGDRVNAAHARYLQIRRLLLIGRLDDATRLLETFRVPPLPPALIAIHNLIVADMALRRIDTKLARAALTRATEASRRAGIAALNAEVENASRLLTSTAARLIARGEERPLLLEEVERLFVSNTLVMDACRYEVRDASTTVSLARRPVLFALARALAEAWPQDVSRDALVSRAFALKRADESLRTRLRVEIGRLRKALRMLATVKATPRGFLLVTHARDVVVLARPIDEMHADVLALLSDGEAWSSSALALALDSSQRTVQRALERLAVVGKVESFGRGRAQRWVTPPLPGFATMLLLPSSLAAV